MRQTFFVCLSLVFILITFQGTAKCQKTPVTANVLGRSVDTNNSSVKNLDLRVMARMPNRGVVLAGRTMADDGQNGQEMLRGSGVLVWVEKNRGFIKIFFLQDVRDLFFKTVASA